VNLKKISVHQLKQKRISKFV